MRNTTFMRQAMVWAMVTLLGATLGGCAVTPARRDAGELREVALPAANVMEVAASVLATQGYELRPVSASMLVGVRNFDTTGGAVASTAAGATVGGVVSAAGGGPVGGILAGLSVGLATSPRARTAQVTVQAVDLDDGASAVRATAVVNGSLRPDYKPLADFWVEVGKRATVGEATERAKAALPLSR